MRDSSENIYLICIRCVIDFFRQSIGSLQMLLYKKPVSKDGIFFAWIHHILSVGPKKFHDRPTGIGISRSIITPIAFLISHKRNPPQDVSHK